MRLPLLIGDGRKRKPTTRGWSGDIAEVYEAGAEPAAGRRPGGLSGRRVSFCAGDPAVASNAITFLTENATPRAHDGLAVREKDDVFWSQNSRFCVNLSMREETRGDVELLSAARAGDGLSFEAFYVRRRGLVLAFFHRRVGDPETVADLTGETFAAALVVVLDRERDLPIEPVAWLLVIARNKLIDSLRRGRVENVARERLVMQPLNLDDEDLARIDAIASSTSLEAQLEVLLTPEQLQALRARILDERDYPDIAAQLECSEAVVRKRVSRALRTLRGAMEMLR